MSTKSKSKSKPKTKSSAKPKPKRSAKPKSQSAKPKPKKAAPKPKSKSNGNGNGRLTNPEYETAARRATELALSDGRGGLVVRGPVSTVAIATVTRALSRKRKSAAEMLKACGFKSTAEAVRYAGGKIGRTDLPSGAVAGLNEFATVVGEPKKHKLTGRKMAAVLVAIAKK